MHADWYFDFVSPFSYLASTRLDTLPATVEVRCRPVLFAGLLRHWGHLGPAEIPAKRIQTYRWCTWWAKREGIAFRMPPAHPFNPLPLLRLSIVTGNRADCVRTIFSFVFAEGNDPDREGALDELGARLGIGDPRPLIDRPQVKDALREHTTAAIERGVFGVPTLDVGGELFWGVDVMPLAADFIRDPTLFSDGEYRRVSGLPVASARRATAPDGGRRG